MSYRDRRVARAARLRRWAEARTQKAAASFQTAHDRAAQIPFGQPILIGHHSERRQRRELARIDRHMELGVEHQQKAVSMESRAAEIDRQAERSIYRDDEDAIPRLEARIAELEAHRARRKQINAEIRRGTGWETRVTPPITDDEREDLIRVARFTGRGGYPPYALQNLAGNIARQRARLDQLRRAAAQQTNEAAP